MYIHVPLHVFSAEKREAEDERDRMREEKRGVEDERDRKNEG